MRVKSYCEIAQKACWVKKLNVVYNLKDVSFAGGIFWYKTTRLITPMLENFVMIIWNKQLFTALMLETYYTRKI